MEITYDSIKPLIISEEAEGPMIKLKFKASNQESPLETVAYVATDQNEIMANLTMQIGKSVATNVAINAGSSMLGNAIGGIGGSLTKAAGSVAASEASAGMMNTGSMMNTEITEEKKQAAIVQAFTYLATYYKHNGTEWEYVQPGA